MHQKRREERSCSALIQPIRPSWSWPSRTGSIKETQGNKSEMDVSQEPACCPATAV